MKRKSSEELNLRLGAPGRIAFREREGFTCVVLANRFATCELSLYGGHVLSYRPVGLGPLLFLSEKAVYREGRAIRGGIPLCWPWFGASTEPGKPSHGFARISWWEVASTTYTSETTEVTLKLLPSLETRALWDFNFDLTLLVRLGESLHLEMTTVNLDSRPMPLTQAFHPYFLVRDIAQTTVAGVDKAKIWDYTSASSSVQAGTLKFEKMTNLFLLPPANGCQIQDHGLRRVVTEIMHGTRSLVIWNPGQEQAPSLSDFGDGEYRKMVCIEPAQTRETAVVLQPGEKTSLSMEIQAQMMK